MGWLAADFVTDLTDGLVVGKKGWLAADFEADVADGLAGIDGFFLQTEG